MAQAVKQAHQFTRKSDWACGACDTLLDNVSLEEEGRIWKDEFCRKCGSNHFHLDMTKRKVKDKHGKVVKVVEDPTGRTRYWELLKRLDTMSRKQHEAARREWEEFISTRPNAWWWDAFLSGERSELDSEGFLKADPNEGGFDRTTLRKYDSRHWDRVVTTGRDGVERVSYKGRDIPTWTPQESGELDRVKQADKDLSKADKAAERQGIVRMSNRPGKVKETRADGTKVYETRTRKVDTGETDEKGKKIYRQEPPREIFHTPYIRGGNTRAKDKSGGKTAKSAIKNVSVGEYVEEGFRTARR